MKIVINGAGIAGPTLAYWLRKSGHEVVLVEAAPGPRRGGYVVDFWGVGYDIAERMGILPKVHDAGYAVREVRFVGRDGRKRGGFPVEAFQRITHGRFTSLRRSDLAAAIYGTLDGVETLFGDSIAAIEESAAGVHVLFERAPPMDADLVVGADGLHSRVRRLAFGPQEGFEVALGYHVAAFEARGYRPRDDLVYVTHGLPGRQISRFAMRDDATLFLFVFRDEYLGPDATPEGRDAKAEIERVFEGVGWEWPAIRAAIEQAGDLYFDRVSQIRMQRWSRGRVALIGDAAAAVSLLAGEGSGLAMAEAYVLAGELAASGGDHARAFSRYEERLAAFIRRKQAGAARFASSFAPRTPAGLAFRDLASALLRLPRVAEWVLGRDLRDDVEVPRYSFGGLNDRP